MNRNKIKRLLAHLKKAQALLDGMSNENKEEILKLHNENSTIQYCLRWGVTAAEDVLDDYPKRVKK
ncbi:MAG: hypothetical protein WAW23_08375 [Candidatus Methanoperedens sp.]